MRNEDKHGRPTRERVESFYPEDSADWIDLEAWRRQHALCVWNAAMAVLMACMAENSCYTYCEHWYGSGLVKR